MDLGQLFVEAEDAVPDGGDVYISKQLFVAVLEVLKVAVRSGGVDGMYDRWARRYSFRAEKDEKWFFDVFVHSFFPRNRSFSSLRDAVEFAVRDMYGGR